MLDRVERETEVKVALLRASSEFLAAVGVHDA